MTALDRVDRKRRGEDRRVLDVAGLTEIRRSAEVLDGGGEIEDRLRVVEGEGRLRRLRRGAELLRRGGERCDVRLLVLADRLDQRQLLALEQAAL